MRTYLKVLGAGTGKLRAETDYGSISGREAREKCEASRALLTSHGWRVRTWRTVNEAGRRWVLVFVEDTDKAASVSAPKPARRRPAVPKRWPVQPLKLPLTTCGGQEIATCGTCGRSWDDAKVTSMTPTPAGRCPFESFH